MFKNYEMLSNVYKGDGVIQSRLSRIQVRHNHSKSKVFVLVSGSGQLLSRVAGSVVLFPDLVGPRSFDLRVGSRRSRPPSSPPFF